MRILFITPTPPHPTQGGAAIRNWHLIRAAQAAGHETHWLTFGLAMHDAPDRPAVSRYHPPQRTVTRRVRNLARAVPDLALRLDSWHLQRAVQAAIDESGIDLVQIEGLEMWPALPDALSLSPVIYDAHNAETALQRTIARQAWRDRDLPRALFSTVQTRKLARYEATALRRAAITLAVSEADAAALRALAPEAAVAVVPIGVDTCYYAPEHRSASAPVPHDVVFSGTMDYHANADAALWMACHVWPLVRTRHPTATLAIVGKNPTARIRDLTGHDGITVTGEVADDRPYMAGARVYALPIRVGAGVRVKMLNAMSMGCAVIATPAACAGVAVMDGTDVVITDPEPAPFAAAIADLLDDSARCRGLGAAARRLICDRYDWSRITPRLLAVYERLERAHG